MYCFTIRINFVVALIPLMAVACMSHAQQLENPPAATEEVAQSADPAAGTPADGEPTDPEVMYRVFAAEMLGNEGDLAGAVGEYLEAAMESDDPAIAMRATRVAFAAQAWQQASMAADRWALLDPTNIAARESAALAMLATADYAGAELQLKELLALSQDKEAAWASISSLLARSPSTEKSMKLLDNLLSEEGQSGSAAGYYAQSQLAVRAGDFARAYSLARQAAELQDDRVQYLSWAASLAISQDDKKAGLDYIRRAWELQPDDHDLTLAYADVLARDGQADESREVVRNMVQTPDVMLTRILFELSARQPEAALQLYNEFRTMEFDDPQERAYYLGRAAEALNLLQEAIDFYIEVESGENYLDATARRAELMALSGDIQGAKNTLAELRLDADPAVAEQTWLTEARILQRAGDREGALQSLDLALEQFGVSISIRYAHALLAAELGRVELAEADLRFILVEQPDNAMALNALGYTLADLTDRYAEAEDLIRRAYALEPEDASITDSMGWVAYRLGRLDEAAELLERAWELDNNPEIAAHLGEVLWMQDNKDQARLIWGKGLEVDSSNAVLIKTIQRLDVEN